jgi:hypothetical protein
MLVISMLSLGVSSGKKTHPTLFSHSKVTYFKNVLEQTIDGSPIYIIFIIKEEMHYEYWFDYRIG